MRIIAFLLIFFSPIHLNSKNIDIVYHIATLNHWKEIVREQLRVLEQSGLGTACDSITVTVVGPQIHKVYSLFKNLTFHDKVTIIHASANLLEYEFPGIEMVREIALKKPKTRILYMHTKGVTHFNKPSDEPVHLWRRYMEYFNIECWRLCLDALKTVKICGVDYTNSIHGHYFFAGNFWWGKASYISTCRLKYNNRFDCEDFIGRGENPIAKSFHQSGNPKMQQLFPQEIYPQYYFFSPSSSYHKGILNLYNFCYFEEYYKP
jgi:hypothetical protein